MARVRAAQGGQGRVRTGVRTTQGGGSPPPPPSGSSLDFTQASNSANIAAVGA